VADPRRLVATLWRRIGFVAVAIAAAYCLNGAFDPPRLNWGDSASDYNVMTAGRNFDRYGFVQLQFTPRLLDARLMTRRDKDLVYTHYPQLPDVMNGVERRLGLWDIVHFRLVALLFSFGALFFVYRLARHYWSESVAQLSLALWVCNPLWLQHVDHLHQVPYAAFFGFGSLYFLQRHFQDGRPRWLATSGVFLMLTYFASYDYWLFAPLLLAAVTAAEVGTLLDRRAARVLGLLALFAVAALAIKFATNVWVLGWNGFVDDMRFQFVERATDRVVQTSYMKGLWPTLYGRVDRCFSLLFFGVTAFWLVVPLLRRRWSDSTWLAGTRRNPIVLLGAALPFLLLFLEIWIGQYYPTLLVLPFYAVGSAALAMLLLESARPAAKLGGAALALLLVGHSLAEGFRFEKATISRDTIDSLGARLDSVSAPGQAVLINHVFDTFYRYYFDRKTVPLILTPPQRLDSSMTFYTTHPRSGSATPRGAIFVEHKRVERQFFDKAYYYLLAQQPHWSWWGNPDRHRAELDSVVAERDSILMRRIARQGVKLYETDDYVIWGVRPDGRK